MTLLEPGSLGRFKNDERQIEESPWRKPRRRGAGEKLGLSPTQLCEEMLLTEGPWPGGELHALLFLPFKRTSRVSLYQDEYVY